MAEIIIFPGGPEPHLTALELEARGYRVDPVTGRAERAVPGVAQSLARVFGLRARWATDADRDPPPSAA